MAFPEEWWMIWLILGTVFAGEARGADVDDNTGKTGVVINEFVADPAEADTNDNHWLELYNSGFDDVDLSGWSLLGGTTSSGSLGDPFPDGVHIVAGGYLVVGGALAFENMTPDVVLSFQLGNASSADGIMLVDPDLIVHDVVVYGTTINETDEWPQCDGMGTATKHDLAPKPGSGEAIGRVPDGEDTDDCSFDFSSLPFPTPWTANDQEGDCLGADDIKINEFYPNPDSEKTAADDGAEWIELYNAGDEAVDVAGWVLQWGTSSYSGNAVLPEGTTIGAGDFLVLGGELVTEADIIVSESDDITIGTASSTPDAVQLLHCGPGVADTVVYGGVGADNTDGWLDDSGQEAKTYGPKPTAGLTLARREDGVDTNDSSIDFVVAEEATIGAPNPQILCDAGLWTLKINEASPYPADGTGHEWIELFNTGDDDIVLDNWEIEAGTSGWSTRFKFPQDSVVSTGEMVIIGDEGVPSESRDYVTSSNLSLGNASTGFDGIRVVDCEGVVQDTLLYGKSDALPQIEDPSDPDYWEVDDAGGQTAAIFPADQERTIGRYPDGLDSDDNAVDFCSGMAPSPGLLNAPCVVDVPPAEGSLDTETGCAKSSDGDSSKCSAISRGPSSRWLVMCLVTWVVLRRRRHL